MASRKEEREGKVCTSIKTLKDDSDAQTSLIKKRWRDNYDMFVYGTQNTDKQDWQTNFSVNKLASSVRTAQGSLVNTLVNTPDWYSLDPASDANQQAEQLAPVFQKLLDYYLTASNFKKHAGTFFMCALISSGNMHIGWKRRLVQNPKYILEVTDKMQQAEQRRLATKVTNPQVESPDALNAEDFQNALSSAIDDFAKEAQGKPIKSEPTPQYTQIGCLDIKDINHERSYWDPNVMYMEDSIWRAFEFDVQKYELNQMAKDGFVSKAAVNRIGSQKDLYVRTANSRLRYNNTVSSPRTKNNTIKMTYYAGPLIIDDEIVKDKYYALIANDDILLKEGDYPFWEPPGHTTSIITAAVRQIPYRATGAGIGDNAVNLQKLYDSNWQLVCDTFRYGIAGVNIVNYQNLVDKSQLMEGIYPGMTLEVRGKPEDSFKHIELTSNLESQASPVQTMLEQAIDNLTGVNELMQGGNNPYSRTSAAETNAKLASGNENVNIIALDLEQNFLVPALQKCLARVLQFGVTEVNTNPELQALLDPGELNMLSQLNAGDRLTILNQWYTFTVKGFSSSSDKNLQAQRDNELLQIINSGGPLASLINLPEFMKIYFKNRDIKDPDKLLLLSDNPMVQTTAENQVLQSGHPVMPAQTDDHQFHISQHSPLANSPFGSQATKMHTQQHMMMLQQQQQAAKAGQQAPGQQPQGAPGPQPQMASPNVNPSMAH